MSKEEAENKAQIRRAEWERWIEEVRERPIAPEVPTDTPPASPQSFAEKLMLAIRRFLE